ncbi:MAG: response regulator [Deltaproteobacteria bacterium]|nr:response regulator [Deltaproteobacteria bacterium]
MKVIIADDSSSIRRKLAEFLTELGHQVIGQAQNGHEVVKLVALHQPDLVTLDLVMPELDGLSALRAIRYENRWTNIVMITGLSTVAHKTAALEAGATAFLKKPILKSELQKIIEKLNISLKKGEAA